MKKKKILFIINSLVGGGTEKVLITLLKHFDYFLFDVDLLLIYKEGEFLVDLPKEVKIIYLYPNKQSFIEKINYNLLSRFGVDFGYKLLMNCKVKKYDTIISFYGGVPLKYHTSVVHKAKNNISWVHTDIINNHHTIGRFFTETQEKEAYNKMDTIVFVSNDAKKQFEKLYPDILVPKKVILNPIEKDLITQNRNMYKNYDGSRCFNITSVGRLSEEKGFDRLVRLAGKLRENNYNFHITIVGEGSARDKLEDLIVEYKLQSYVSLPGFFKPPYSKIAKSDLFLLTSLVEGYPLVLCEAFCLGLPVIATRVTGSSELIDNNKYGILVDHDDDSIYQGVKRMIDDEQLRLHYHKMSLERAKMFNIKETMNQVYNVL
jgi:glycosyltransferase involved in cell wall biosynthesis